MKSEMILTCYCCKNHYQRGKFRCCAPPNNMSAYKWQERWCRVELANGERCNRCPRCGCEHRTAEHFTGSEIGWSTVANIKPNTRKTLVEFAEKYSQHNS